MTVIKVAIIDDQTLFRESLANLIQSHAAFDLVAAAENGQRFLTLLDQLPALPDVALVDMAMPEMNGIQLSEHLRAKYPGIRPLILSSYAQERYIYKMITGGAAGYLVKTCGKAELIEAIQTVYEKGFYLNAEALKAIQHATKYAHKSAKSINDQAVELTRREIEILQLICQEYKSPDIADKLHLSIRTIEGHRNHLLLKTGCHNTAGLVLFAIRNRLFDPEF